MRLRMNPATFIIIACVVLGFRTRVNAQIRQEQTPLTLIGEQRYADDEIETSQTTNYNRRDRVQASISRSDTPAHSKPTSREASLSLPT